MGVERQLGYRLDMLKSEESRTTFRIGQCRSSSDHFWSSVDAERGCRVLGVDAAPKMITAAAALANSESGSGLLRFQHVETIAQLPLDSHSADGILCSSVLEYVPDPEACLTEFARVLRLGGILVVSVPSAYSLIRNVQITCYRVGQFVGKDWVAY